MTFALSLLGGLVLAVVVIVVYMTLAVNAEANRQDRVKSVPPVGTARDEFLRALHGAAGQRTYDGNDVTVYQNGDEIFPPMLAAIHGARSTVHLSTYVYWAGTIPETFALALSDAARRGVVVRVVLDSEGTEPMPRTLIDQMRTAGCNIAWFRRAEWHNWTKYNHRTHRRLLVVDGTVAFTGGVGIADEWSGHGQSPKHWRDTHARVTGPIVSALQAAFADNWNLCTEEILLDGRDYPELRPTGDVSMCPVVSTPASGASPAQRVMAACVTAASRTLHITNAYFVPTPPFIDALCKASERGVDVKVVTPGPYIDSTLVRRASRHCWPRLLASGVEIHEYQPTMIHAKTLIVDGELFLVGSINFDPRSFSLNAECGVVIANARIAADAERVFAEDIAHCTRIESRTLDALSMGTRLIDGLCYWFRAQL